MYRIEMLTTTTTTKDKIAKDLSNMAAARTQVFSWVSSLLKFSRPFFSSIRMLFNISVCDERPLTMTFTTRHSSSFPFMWTLSILLSLSLLSFLSLSSQVDVICSATKSTLVPGRTAILNLSLFANWQLTTATVSTATISQSGTGTTGLWWYIRRTSTVTISDIVLIARIHSR